MNTTYMGNGVYQADNGDMLVMPRCLKREAMESRGEPVDWSDAIAEYQPKFVSQNREQTLKLLQRLMAMVDAGQRVECLMAETHTMHRDEPDNNSHDLQVQFQWTRRGGG